MQIKVLVACRQWQQAIDLGEQLAKATDGCIAAEAAGIDSALRRGAQAGPDVLLVEYALDDEQRTWDIMSRLPQVSPATRILVLCDTYTQRMVMAFIQHGASGCLAKSSDPSLLAKAVRTVHGGDTWFGRTELLQALRRQIIAQPAVPPALLEHHDLLTAREREIMAFVGNALSNKEIARRLKISDKTVKTHLHHIYVKLQKSGRYKVFLSNAFTAPAPLPAAPDRSQAGGFAAE